MMAVISPNPQKAHPRDYTIRKENGTSAAFVGFLMYLIAKCFLLHNEFLVMDNAIIHSRGNARVIVDMLWDTIVNGHPLHILVIHLLTHNPELNPIELVFNILVMWICSFWYQTAGPCDNATLHKVAKVMNNMSCVFIFHCCTHCGY
jgi:hypothetical protein